MSYGLPKKSHLHRSTSPKTDLRTSPRDVLRRFRILFGSIRTHYKDVESKCGVSGSQLWALTEIQRIPDITVSELAASLMIHQSTASNLLDGLKRMALVLKVRAKEDQRFIHLRLTAKGQKLLARAPKPTEGVLLDALQRLPAGALKRLAADMDTLEDIMVRHDKRAERKLLSDI